MIDGMKPKYHGSNGADSSVVDRLFRAYEKRPKT
jgi:hypothetical protein